MLLYQIKTSKTVTEKLAAVGGEGSVAKEILDGLKWRLGHDPNLGYVIDEKRNIREPVPNSVESGWRLKVDKD